MVIVEYFLRETGRTYLKKARSYSVDKGFFYFICDDGGNDVIVPLYDGSEVTVYSNMSHQTFGVKDQA